MEPTLFAVKIDEMDLTSREKKLLLENGYDSVSSILLEKKEDLTQLGFSSVQLTKIRKKAVTLAEKHGFGWEDVSKRYGGLIIKKEFYELANMDHKTYVQLEKKGFLDDLIVKVGIDVAPSLDKKTFVPKYVLKKDKAIEFAENCKSLGDIAKEMNISYSIFQNYSLAGNFDVARMSRTRWNKKWITENFMKIKESLRKNAKKNVQENANTLWQLLAEEHRKLISEYIEYRKDSTVIFTKYARYEAFLTKDAFIYHRDVLTRIFYSIICARSGLKNYWVTTDSGFGYRSLTEEELPQYDPSLFQLDDLKESDIQAISHGRKSPRTRMNYKNTFLGLFYYTLMRKKEKINERANTSSDYKPETDFAALVWKADFIEEAFEKYLPVNRKQMRLTTSRSVYLNRQVVAALVRRVLENDSGKLQYPLKCAAMFALAFFGIIRPVELWRLKIEDLQPNQKTGLLELKDIHGYQFARITIQSEISKMNLSPSGPYGLLLVPRAVRIVNHYLSELYEKYPEHKGTGYLFRPYTDEFNPNAQYANAKTMFEWVSNNKSMFADILSTEQLKNFSSYDTRHTGNNLIANETFFNDPKLEQSKEKVAEYHARHKGIKSVNRENYQAHLTENIYATIINAALNFPLDKNELEEWEEDMSRKATHNQMEENQKDHKCEAELDELDEEISKLNEELKQLGKVSYYKKLGLSNDERIARAKKLQEEVRNLTAKKNKVRKELS
ncbi:hypothetical protein [Ureibacillus sp. GCM10028918]|uniref:hypothetical protein n=1 Tax=Ureibacillus sp. GCM10028918 TaxID=3273429 RepID=UPI0036174445